MGIELVASSPEDMVKRVRELTKPTGSDALRRHNTERKVRLYYNDYKKILRDHIYTINPTAPEAAAALEPFIATVGGSSFLTNVADIRARPLYAGDPVRRVMRPGDPRPNMDMVQPGRRVELPKPSPDQAAYEGLIEEMDANRVLDQAFRLLTPSPKVFLFPRLIGGEYDEPQEATLDLLTADMVWAIPDPRKPTRALAILYALESDSQGNPTRIVCWDNRRYLTIDAHMWTAKVTDHDYGILPFVEVSQRTRPGMYWPLTVGDDLEAQSLQSLDIDLILAFRAWTQRHIQLVFRGDPDGAPRNQILNEKSILFIGGGTDGQLIPINLEGDPSHLLKLKADNEASVAASYGISRERLNQVGNTNTDDGLQERVAELAQEAYRSEQQLFRVCKSVFRAHPEHRPSADARVVVDLGYLHDRVDRKSQLEYYDAETKLGLRSAIDTVLEENPEYMGDRQLAMWHIEQRTLEQAAVYQIQRVTNAPKGTNTAEPGQDPTDNGRMGPMVRDGQMTKDMAAKMSEGGSKKPDPAADE